MSFLKSKTLVLCAVASMALPMTGFAKDRNSERLRPLDFAPFEEALTSLTKEQVTALDKALPNLAVADLQRIMASDQGLNSEILTLYLLRRISRYDNHLRTYLELNPAALDEALAADQLRAEGTVLGPLHGIPISLKDNIDTAGPMHTTVGAELFLDNVAEDDAELVQQLRDGGAVILGKANLSEFAGVITLGKMFGGASAVGGQGLNPHGEYPTAGSSSGSAGGVAAKLAIVSVGTETSGSLIAPSAFQGVVGMKPSRGLVSGDGVFPLLDNNDSPGPIGRSVRDIAALLQVIDSADTDYLAALDAGALSGVQVGVMSVELLSRGEQDLLARIATTLVLAGADTLPATLKDSTGTIGSFPVYLAAGIRYDMIPAITALRSEIDSADALVSYNEANAKQRTPFGQDAFVQQIAIGTDISSEDFQALTGQLRDAAAAALDTAFANSNTDVLISIDNMHSQYYATAGYPAVTVPLGLRTGGGIMLALGQDGAGMPAGVTLIGRQGEDAALLAYAYAFEQNSQFRITPPDPD